MNGLFLTEQEKKSLALHKLSSRFRVSTMEDADEFIRVAEKKFIRHIERKIA